MSISDVVGLGGVELGMFLVFPDQSDGTNRQNSVRFVDWWSQIGLGGSGTCVRASPYWEGWCQYVSAWGIW